MSSTLVHRLSNYIICLFSTTFRSK